MLFLTLRKDSQNAGLRPAMLAIAVSVRRGNFAKIVLSRFHVRFVISTTLQMTGKYAAGQVKIPGITSATPNGKKRESVM